MQSIRRELCRGVALSALSVPLASCMATTGVCVRVFGSALEQSLIAVHAVKAHRFRQKVLPWEQSRWEQRFGPHPDGQSITAELLLSAHTDVSSERTVVLSLLGQALSVGAGELFCELRSKHGVEQRACFWIEVSERPFSTQLLDPATNLAAWLGEGTIVSLPPPAVLAPAVAVDPVSTSAAGPWRGALKQLTQIVRGWRKDRVLVVHWEAIGKHKKLRMCGKSLLQPNGRWRHSPSAKRILTAVHRGKWAWLRACGEPPSERFHDIWLEERRTPEGDRVVALRMGAVCGGSTSD